MPSTGSDPGPPGPEREPSARAHAARHAIPRATREQGAVIGGRYLVERELGHGAMAVVLLARDLARERFVAVKLVHATHADGIGLERFHREIDALARLQHPHILPLIDAGEVTQARYYVMPYVVGETLRERLRRDRCLAIDDGVRIAREIAGALAHAHAHGIVHRDVKPENILLAGGRALIADFGIARELRRPGGRRLTDDGYAIGTPAYMSPEQASGDPADERSDQYSLACVLFEMLAGTPPFHGGTTGSLLARRLTERAAPLRMARPGTPAAVDAAVARALAPAPEHRFASVAAFARALAPEDDEPTRRRPWWEMLLHRRRRA